MPRHAEAIAKTDEPEFGSAARIGLLDVLRQWPDAAARALIIAVALILAWHTWAHWGSVESDCGRELYLPLEILRGKLLYRDLWCNYGPLTPYTQAALIAIFGRHLDAFYVFGIALAIGCSLLLYRIGTMLQGRAVGLAAACAMLLPGFGPSTFNYGFPYTYAAPLGLFLGLISAWLTIAFLLEGRLWKLAVACVSAALALLCKPEIGAATYVMVAFAIGAAAIAEHSWRELFRCVAACIPGVALWTGIYGWFLWKVTPSVFLFENWINTPGTYYARTFAARVYRFWGLRIDAFDLSIVAASAGVVLLLWILICRGARVRPAARGNLLFAGWCVSLICVALAARLGANSKDFSALVLAFLVFPAGMVLVGLGFLLSRLRAAFKSGFSNRVLADAAFTVFALVMSVRVLSDVSPYFYGLFYAAPLSLVFLIVIARLLGALMRDVEATRRRNLIHAALALEVALIAILVVPGAGKRTAPFHTPWGTIYLTPGDAAGARKILDFTMEQKRKGRAVVFLPELPMMYALAGTEAPSMWYFVVPGLVPPKKEVNYISDLKHANPDYILITDQDQNVYGAPYFGLDYNRQIYRWIEKKYRVVGELGNFRREKGEKGAPLAALIYERNKPGN